MPSSQVAPRLQTWPRRHRPGRDGLRVQSLSRPIPASRSAAGTDTCTFARFLETKHVDETIPAIEDVVNHVNAIYKCQAVYRIHADRASELVGHNVKSYFKPRGIIVTDTG